MPTDEERFERRAVPATEAPALEGPQFHVDDLVRLRDGSSATLGEYPALRYAVGTVEPTAEGDVVDEDATLVHFYWISGGDVEENTIHARTADLALLDRQLTAGDLVEDADGRHGVVHEFSLRVAVSSAMLAERLRHFLPSAAASAVLPPFLASEAPTDRRPPPPGTLPYAAFKERHLLSLPAWAVMPLHPFRPEACVVHRESMLVGMVQAVDEAAVLVTDDGWVCVCANRHLFRDGAMLACPGDRLELRRSDFRDGAPRDGPQTAAKLQRVLFIGSSDQRKSKWRRVRSEMATVALVVPVVVHASFSPNGAEFEEAVPVHPRDLAVVDAFYAEFCMLYQVALLRPDVVAALEAGDTDLSTLRRPEAVVANRTAARHVDPYSDVPEEAPTSAGPAAPELEAFGQRAVVPDTVRHAVQPPAMNAFYRDLFFDHVAADVVVALGTRLPDGSCSGDIAALIPDTPAAWGAYLERARPYVQGLVVLRETSTALTVAWSDGSVGRLPATECSVRGAGDMEVAPLQLVMPSAMRAQTFPMTLPPDGLLESTGLFDAEPYPEHCVMDVQPGDTVSRLLASDDAVVRAMQPAVPQASHVGQVLAVDVAESTATVRWHTMPQRPLLPAAMPAPIGAAAKKAREAAVAHDEIFDRVFVGVVLHVFAAGHCLVQWWDGALEELHCTELVVYNFPPLDAGEGEEEEEEEGEEDEGVEEAEEEAPASSANTPAQSPAAPAPEEPESPEVKPKEVEAAPEAPPTAESEPTAPADNSESPEPEEAQVKGSVTFADRYRAHIFRTDGAAFVAAEPARFTRRVQQEWRQLQRELPAGVHVRLSEEEPHLLKFALVGAAHTPYYHGFYCFDVALPPEYPAKPPEVRFHSHRLRLNPNLYDDGYVCLSLLGTWEGHADCERWNPVVSNVLQVALSVHAMILNKEPYYNEPALANAMGTPEGRERAKQASEAYYLLRIQHLIAMARATPPDWVPEFRAQFLAAVPGILRRGEEYVQGAGAGHTEVAAGRINVDGLVVPLSPGLCRSLPNYLAQLRRVRDECSASWSAE